MSRILQSPTAAPFDTRESRSDRFLAQRNQIFDQVGTHLIQAQTTADETTFVVSFNNIFVEKPIFTYGFELAQGAVTPGSAPTGSALVTKWTQSTGPNPSYTGATICVVTTGIATQQLYIHYSFKGRANAYPADTMPTTGLAKL